MDKAQQLEDACKAGQLDRVKQLVREGTPIHEAATIALAYQHCEVARWLYLAGADFFSVRGAHGFWAAAQLGDIDAMRMCCEVASELQQRTSKPIPEPILPRFDYYHYALSLAVKANQTEAVQWLLDKGWDPKREDMHCQVAAQTAARAGHMDLFRMLLPLSDVARLKHRLTFNAEALAALQEWQESTAVDQLLDRIRAGIQSGELDLRTLERMF